MRIKLDLPITSKNIEELTGIRIGEKEEKIEFISTNSKDTDKSCLFIPLAKKQAERYAHIDESVKNGAKILADSSLKDNDPHNSVEAMLKLASGYKAMLPNLRKTVAITGSVGKTTTKEITKRIVSKRYRTHSTEGNQNNAIGLSYTILSAPRDTEILVTEIGMNHPGEIKELSSCLHPSIAIITEIGSAHIGNLLPKMPFSLLNWKFSLDWKMTEKSLSATNRNYVRFRERSPFQLSIQNQIFSYFPCRKN